MISVLLATAGGAAGAIRALSWFNRSGTTLFVVASNSLVCALMGAFAALPIQSRGAAAALFGYGLLVTLATPLAVLIPLPRLRSRDELRRLLRRISAMLALITFYGTTFALLGNLLVHAFLHIFIRALYG